MAATIGFEQVAYAVLVTRDNGSKFFASGDKFAVLLFGKRRAALDYANELGEHIERRRLRVVKLQVSGRMI